MKKIIYYIPLIITAILYGILVLIGERVTLNYFVVLTYAISGYCLSKNKWWGGFFGMYPGFVSIHKSTIDTGQLFSEKPISIVIILFYLLCGIFVYFKNRKKVNL